jgi:hypothetical protein
MDDRGAAGDAGATVMRMPLRSGGWIGYDEETIYVKRDADDEGVRILRRELARVSLKVVQWDLVVMSVLLVGVGAFVAATRSLPVGAAFAAIGCWSLYRTYGNRYALRIQVRNRPTPVEVHPVEPTECFETLSEFVPDAEPDGSGASTG